MPNAQYMQFGPWIPFPGPVVPPASDVFDAPFSVLIVSDDWIPYINGALKVLRRDQTWEEADDTTLGSLQRQIDALMASWSSPDVLGIPPVGSIVSYGGSSSPSNWLICDGSAISRTTYDKLFAVIGTTYGHGDNSTTFNLPDFAAKFPLGPGSFGLSIIVPLGSSGGDYKTNLSVPQLPAHHHTEQVFKSTTPFYQTANTSSGTGSSSENRLASSPASSRTVLDLNTADTGSGDDILQIPPFTSVNFIIRYQ